MSAGWPALLPGETVTIETRTPFMAVALLCLAGAGLGLLGWAAITGSGSDPKGAVLALIGGALLAWLAQMPLTVSRLIVTSHRVAIRRGFGQRYSLMFPQIADMQDGPLSLTLTTAGDDRRHLLALVSDRRRTAQAIRQGLAGCHATPQ